MCDPRQHEMVVRRLCRLGNLAAPRTVIACLIAVLCAGAAGCQSLSSEPQPGQARTVTEFMKQDRPGNGVLGP